MRYPHGQSTLLRNLVFVTAMAKPTPQHVARPTVKSRRRSTLNLAMIIPSGSKASNRFGQMYRLGKPVQYRQRRNLLIYSYS